MRRPDRTEAADSYFTYIDQVDGTDVCGVLAAQRGEVEVLLRSVDETLSLHRYAPDKWNLREVMSHVNDTERVFAYRALWFARGFEAPLPGFDQEVAIVHAAAGDRSWASHLEEFGVVRETTLALFRNLPEHAWSRGGIASDHPVTVRALAFITAGHVAHHLRIVRERYMTTFA